MSDGLSPIRSNIQPRCPLVVDKFGKFSTTNGISKDTQSLNANKTLQAVSVAPASATQVGQKALVENGTTLSSASNSTLCKNPLVIGEPDSIQGKQTQFSITNPISRIASATSHTKRASRYQAVSSDQLDQTTATNSHPGFFGVGEPGLAQATSPDDGNPSKAWFQKTVLTFDGGGIRGYASLLILQRLMYRISQLEMDKDSRAENSSYPSAPPKPVTDEVLPRRRMIIPGQTEDSLQRTSRYLPCHYFDYIAGTSTGGLIAIMLGRFGMTVAQCLAEYERIGDRIFKHPRIFHIRNPPPFWSTHNKYDTRHLETLFIDMVRKYEPNGLVTFPQKHKDMCRTITLAVHQHNITTTNKPYLFRSYPHPNDSGDSVDCLQISDDNIDIWKVARATTAAPTYFEPLKAERNNEDSMYLDGGFGFNCPSEQVYNSIQELSNGHSKSVRAFVGIGTGLPPPAGNPKRNFGKMLLSPNLKQVSRLLSAALVQATSSEKIHDRFKKTLKNNGVPYYRLNVDKDIGHIKLDAFKGKDGCKTLDQLISATQTYLNTNTEATKMIDEAANILVDHRRKRACLEGPNVPAAKSSAVPLHLNGVPYVSSNGKEQWQDRRDRWEVFVHGVVYACKLRNCDWTNEKREDRQTLRHHYVDEHGLKVGSSEIEEELDKSRKYPPRKSAAQENEVAGGTTSRQTTFASS